MTGHLEEISQWCKFEDSAWADPKGKGENGWEELPYWLKGYGDLGYVLKDEEIIRERPQAGSTRVLASQEPDGWFGPRANKTSLDKKRAGRTRSLAAHGHAQRAAVVLRSSPATSACCRS